MDILKRTQPLLQGLLLFSFFLCPFFMTSRAQSSEQKKIDSLLSLSQKKKDTAVVSALLELNKIYFFKGKYDSCLYYCRKAIDLSSTLKNYKMANLFLAAGRNYYMKGPLDSAQYYVDLCTPYLSKSDDETAVLIYSLSASIYSERSMSDKALELFLAAEKILEKPENKRLNYLYFNTLVNIGGVFLSEKEYDKAEEYFNKASRLSEFAQSKVFIVQLYQKKFIAYTNKNQLDKAEKCLDSSVVLLKGLNNLDLNQAIYVNYGFLYEKKKLYQKSKESYLKALKLNDSLDNRYYLSRILNNLSSVSISMKQWPDAKQFAEKAFKAAQNVGSFIDMSYAYGNLRIISAETGNYKEALKYAELQYQYADSASSMASKNKVLELESKYQHQRKENEIANLKLSNTSQELEIIKRNRLLLIGGILLIAVFITFFLLYTNTRQKRLIAEKDQKLKEDQIKYLEKQQHIVSLQSMINGQETERTRIAKDLHDGLGGLFSTLKMFFSSLQHDHNILIENPIFQKSYDLVNTAAEEVRRIAHNMMPEVLLKIGLVQAIRELCNNISAGKLLAVSFQSYGMDMRLNPSTEIMLYRILQELLSNIIKHANATEVIVQFNRQGNRLSVTVEDNGKGFNLADTDEGLQAGLNTVKSRVQYLNGKLSIDSQKEMGTTIMMEFLINDPSA